MGLKKAFQSCHASHVVSWTAASYSVFCVLKAEHGEMSMSVSTAKPFYITLGWNRRWYQDVNEVYLENSFLVL